MRNKTLQSFIATGRFTLPAVILIAICCWTAMGIGTGTPATRLLPSFALCGLMGYLLVETNNNFALIRVRASGQTALYLLLAATYPALYSLYNGQAASVCFLLAVMFLFRSYRGEHTSACLFHVFAFASISSLFIPQLTLFVPVLWIGAYNFHSLNVRSFIASLIGWALPYWFLLGYAYASDRMELFLTPFKTLTDFTPIGFLSDISQIATFAYVSILFAVGAIHAIVSGNEDKLSTRSYLRFLVLLGVCCGALIGLQPALYNQLLPLLWICASIVGGRLFILSRGRIANIFFVCSVIGAFLLFAFNLWTLL